MLPDVIRFLEKVVGRSYPLVRGQMSEKITPKIREHICPACKGKGFPVVVQPVQPAAKLSRQIRKSCDGKGKITDSNVKVIRTGGPDWLPYHRTIHLHPVYLQQVFINCKSPGQSRAFAFHPDGDL